MTFFAAITPGDVQTVLGWLLVSEQMDAVR
jgi:hypothetical protein